MFQTPDLPAASSPSTKTKARRHAQWLEIIERWRESGLGEQAFCDSIGAKLDTFRKHRYQASKASGKKNSGRAGFKAASITKPAKPVTVEQGVMVLHAPGCRVVLPLDMNMSRVADLVRALGR